VLLFIMVVTVVDGVPGLVRRRETEQLGMKKKYGKCCRKELGSGCWRSDLIASLTML
jgi:hypothetical protein